MQLVGTPHSNAGPQWGGVATEARAAAKGRNCGGDDGAPAPRPVRDLELYMVNEVY